MSIYDYDVIIVGGGPGGATTALYAEQMGLKCLVVDKKSFPRDKICGDALSGKAVVYLRELGLIDKLEQHDQVPVHGVIFSAPNHTAIDIPFDPNNRAKAPGYVCRRMVFDNLLFQEAKEKVETIEDFTVKDLIKKGDQIMGVKGQTKDGKELQFTAKVVIGADGFSSMVARKTGLYEHDSRHLLVATRAYYRNVHEMKDSIELHYVEEVIPGYFWIFPLENGYVNVGIGMVHKYLKQRDVDLRKAHVAATESEAFKNRFKDAELVGDIVAWNLPVGSKRRKAYGNGFLLIGDAAGLIDPFTGEGIGNAMCSAKIAAEVLSEVCKGTDYTENTLVEYQERIWKRLGAEMTLSYNLQRVGKHKSLVNLVVNKAAKSPDVSLWISDMMAGRHTKKALLNPATYFKLLTNRKIQSVSNTQTAS